MLGEYWRQIGLKALYHFNGNSQDSSGNNYHGTDSSISYNILNGKVGQGAVFSSAAANNYYITLPSGVAITTGSVSVWLNAKTGGSPYTIIDRLNGDSRAAPDRRLKFYLNSSQAFLQNNNGNDFSNNFPYSIVNKVINLTVTLASGGTTNWYFMGAPWGSSANLGTITSNGETVRVGKNHDGVNYPFGGDMDELAIFSTILTPKQVRQWVGMTMGKYF